MLCDSHPEEKLQFYCLDCRRPVCPHCLLLGDHKGHQNTPIDQAAETGKETLNAWVEKLRQRIAAAEELLERLRTDEQDVQRNAEAQRNVINTELDHLRELIETKRQELLSKSAIEEKQKRVALQAQVDTAEAVRSDFFGLVNRSTELLDLGSEHAFLAILLPLIQDMKKCASQPLDSSQQVSCAFRPLSTDGQVRSLGNLDLGQPKLMAAPVGLLQGVPGRMQSFAQQPLAHAATAHGLSPAAPPGSHSLPPGSHSLPPGSHIPQYDGLANSYQVPIASDATTQQYPVVPPGFAGVPATVSYLGSHQLPPAQPQSQAQSAMLGQAVTPQSVYVYRSMHQG